MQPSKASTETRLPRAVLRRSEAIAQRYAKPGEPETPNPADAAASAPAPAAAAATTADPPTPPRDPRLDDPKYWEQRFNVTQGLLSKARTENAVATGALQQQIADLQEKITSLSTQAQPAAIIDLKAFYTPEEIEKFGEEQCTQMAGIAMKAARSEAKNLIDAAVRPLEDQRKAERERAAQAAQDRYHADLTEAWPTWQADDQLWRPWLAEVDEKTGITRQELLNVHIAKADAKAIGRMFREWKDSTLPPVPPVTPNGRGAGTGGDVLPAEREAVAALTPLSPGEKKAFFTRSALGKVSDAERTMFEARLRLTAAPAR